MKEETPETTEFTTPSEPMFTFTKSDVGNKVALTLVGVATTVVAQVLVAKAQQALMTRKAKKDSDTTEQPES